MCIALPDSGHLGLSARKERVLAKHAKLAKQNERENADKVFIRASAFDSYLCELCAHCEMFPLLTSRCVLGFDLRRWFRGDAELAEVQSVFIFFLCVSAFSARHLVSIFFG